MLPPQKIIAFDLDGTLTVSKRPITEEMVNLVKELLKKKPVAVISGGWIKQFEAQFLPFFMGDESIAPFIHNLVLLPTSGSQRYEYDLEKKEWQLTDKEPFPEEVKNRAKKLLQEIIDSGSYEIPPNPKGEYIEDRDTQLTFSALGQLAPIEEKRLWDPDQKKRRKIKSVLDPKLPEANVLVNASSSIDILKKGFNKAVGLTRLLDKFGLTTKDMIFVGDGLFPAGNDYSVYEAGIKTVAVKGPEDAAKLIKGWIG